MSSRYDQLLHAIDLFKPRSIVEIGTWSGENAIRMIKQAEKYRKNVQYVGYDLFEDASNETDAAELNVKAHNSLENVENRIKLKCPNADINLIKGNTRTSLNPLRADFAYIDGGHSLETIQNDYDKCKTSSVVIFDDYYIPDAEGNIPDIEKYGCNKIVETLPNALVLPVGTKVKGGGLTQMVLVLGGQ